MTRVSCEPAAGLASRIIAAEALRAVTSCDLGDLEPSGHAPLRRLSSRDLDNDTARAAYALGRRRGHDQGVLEGLQMAGVQAQAGHQSRQSAAVDAAVQSLSGMTAAFREQLVTLEHRLADDTVALAIDIARQILRRELALDPAALLPATREALRHLADGASRITLRLHPQDAALLAPHLDAERQGACHIEPDARLAVGSCLVDADTGLADAGLATRWQAVMDALGRPGEAQP